VIKQDILEKQVKPSYLGIGSNLGNKLVNIEKARNLLINNKILIEDTSSYYETPSWPNRNFPNFINIVIKIKTELSLDELFKVTKTIEKQVGRKKASRNYPRKCDIDILDFKGECLRTQVVNDIVETPHPRMHTRNFVILPLYEVNKTWIHPKKKVNINSLINQLKNMDFSDIRIV